MFALEGLLDTNIFILHLNGTEQVPFAPGKFAVSSLTVFELLQYPGLSEMEERAARLLLLLCLELPVNHSVAEHAARLSRTRRTNPIDILIAATALENNLTLVTKNRRDFSKIPGLEIRDTI